MHGFPARLVTPGLYGFVGATKWLTRMQATTYAANSAYWTDRGWATDSPILTQSRIDTPRGLNRWIPAASSSAVSPGRSTAASRRSRSASTTTRGRRPSSALTAASTTGASGTCPGTPCPAATS